ncbi:MAG: PAS domain S-box protein, partial [Anaerolineae bacterium]|nr:PAS domain S-box protein [Anaerolineae bacterium]
RVMVLHRQWEAGDWEMRFNASLFDQLNNDPTQPVSMTYEFLALENVSESKHLDDILAHLGYKAAASPVDLVVAVLPSANTFLLEHGDDLFPDVPKLFVLPGDENIQIAQTLPQSAIVQSASTQALYNTIEAIFAILPGTQNLVVISGANESDDVYRVRAEAAIAEMVDPSIQVDYLTGLPLDDLLVQVSQLPDHTAILFVSYSGDRNGVDYTMSEVMPFLSEKADAPIFGFIDAAFGKGIVGGNLTSAQLYGETAADIGWQLLTGSSLSGFSVIEGQTADYYDWRQLQRWNIPEDRLPPGSLVEYKTETFWETYRTGILTVAGIIALQTTFIVALVVVLRQRRRAELARQQSESRYRLLAENAADVVWILKANTMRFRYVSPSVERLLGFTADEVLAQPLAQIIAPQSLTYIETEFPPRVQRWLAGDLSALTQMDEIEQIRTDGLTVWTEVSTTIVR